MIFHISQKWTNLQGIVPSVALAEAADALSPSIAVDLGLVVRPAAGSSLLHTSFFVTFALPTEPVPFTVADTAFVGSETATFKRLFNVQLLENKSIIRTYSGQSEKQVGNSVIKV